MTDDITMTSSYNYYCFIIFLIHTCEIQLKGGKRRRKGKRKMAGSLGVTNLRAAFTDNVVQRSVHITVIHLKKISCGAALVGWGGERDPKEEGVEDF